MTPHDLIAAFEDLADAPDGVNRLRELVLQLAVRGKLVAQVPNEEPATKLLGARAIRPAGEPWALPQGWAWSRISALGEVLGGGTPSKANPAFWEGDLPWVSPKDMKVPWLSDSQDHVSAAAVEGSAVKLIPTGSVLMVVRGMILAHSFPVAVTKVVVTVNQDMKALVPFRADVAPYLLTLLQASRDRVLGVVERSTHGTCKLPFAALASLPLPIPPLAEQHRIVARVDELMGLLDRLEAARTTRDEVRRAARDAALAALRDAEDTEAVEAPWGRIAREMDTLFTDPEDVGPLRETMLDLGVRGRLVGQSDEARWTNVRLEDICTHIVDCLHRTPQYTESGFPAIRTTDLRPGRILWETARRVPEHEFLEQTRRLMPEPGDVFYAREGNWGDAAVVPEGVPMCLSQRTMQFRLKKHVDPHYFAWLLNSRSVRSRVGAGTVGMTVPHVNIGDLRKLVLRIPPLAEQHRIVAKVDALMAQCDDLEARLTATRDLQAQFAAAAVHHLEV